MPSLNLSSLRLLAVVWLAAAGGVFGTVRAADEPMAVHAARQDKRVVLDVEVSVAAPAAVVWAVLTDYERMTSFLSSLKSSAVTRRDGDRLEVAQTFETRVGFFKFSASSVRAIQLLPMREIRTTLIEGDFDVYEGSTKLVERGGSTVIVNHSEFKPKAWIPPLVGTAVIESETRKQYGQLLTEIARRAAEAAPAR